jgi:hypothetical protein
MVLLLVEMMQRCALLLKSSELLDLERHETGTRNGNKQDKDDVDVCGAMRSSSTLHQCARKAICLLSIVNYSASQLRRHSKGVIKVYHECAWSRACQGIQAFGACMIML